MLKTKEPKGITLISLVITIIILLILATVAISLAVDSNGLFSKAGDAANSWNTSVAEEEGSIQDMLNIADEMSLTLKPMVTKWNIAAGDTVEIMLYVPQDSDVTINWGDGTEEHYTSSNLTNGVASHTYTDANSDTIVTITGKSNAIGVGNDAKLISIEEWGYTETTVYLFPNCTGLASIASPEKYTFKNVTSFAGTFYGCSSLTSIPDNMFENCTNVTSFERMFAGCSSLTNIGDYAFANCTSAKNFDSLFANCVNLESIPEHLFENTPNVASFRGTFAGCTALTGNALPLWTRVTTDTTTYKGVPDGRSCYYGCTGLTNYGAIPDYWKEEIPG